MRNNRPFAIVRAVIMMILGCVWSITAKSNGDAEKPGKADLPHELTIDLGGGVTMEFVLIHPGSFTMGSDNDRQESANPAHKVTLTKPFYLGKYEVTQEQWEKVAGTNPSFFKGAKHPVETVSWNDCQSFVTKLNEKVPGQTFRLPTEAEWEYACRAGNEGDYCYGDHVGVLDEYAWYGNSPDGNSTTHPVGEKKPNAWGLHDVHGNVYEWCADWYAEYPATAVTDPPGPPSGLFRVIRGGSWFSCDRFCRAADRYGYRPSNAGSRFGVRLAITSVP